MRRRTSEEAARLIEQADWKKGLNNKAALALLNDKPPGTYLLRDSSGEAGVKVLHFVDLNNKVQTYTLTPHEGKMLLEEINPETRNPKYKGTISSTHEIFDFPLLKEHLRSPLNAPNQPPRSPGRAG